MNPANRTGRTGRRCSSTRPTLAEGGRLADPAAFVSRLNDVLLALTEAPASEVPSTPEAETGAVNETEVGEAEGGNEEGAKKSEARKKRSAGKEANPGTDASVDPKA